MAATRSVRDPPVRKSTTTSSMACHTATDSPSPATITPGRPSTEIGSIVPPLAMCSRAHCSKAPAPPGSA